MSVDHYECEGCHENLHADCFTNCEKQHRFCDWCRDSAKLPDIPYGDPRCNDDGEVLSAFCPICAKGGTDLEKSEAAVAHLEAENAALRKALTEACVLLEAEADMNDSAEPERWQPGFLRNRVSEFRSALASTSADDGEGFRGHPSFRDFADHLGRETVEGMNQARPLPQPPTTGGEGAG